MSAVKRIVISGRRFWSSFGAILKYTYRLDYEYGYIARAIPANAARESGYFYENGALATAGGFGLTINCENDWVIGNSSEFQAKYCSEQ